MVRVGHALFGAAIFFATASHSVAVHCPTYAEVANMSNPAVSGFDLSKYPGVWYEVMSHNLPVLTTGCHCTRYSVSVQKDGWNTTFMCKKMGPTATATELHSVNKASSDSKFPGMLKEAWQLPVGHTPATEYWVLDVVADQQGDYQKAFVYSCTSEIFVKQEWIYLFSRTPTLSKTDIDAWMDYMKGKGINTASVQPVPQDAGCWPDLHGRTEILL